MIKVLLVDDEQFIRQGLRRLVDWEKYGYEIVAEAENGLDAIRVLEETDVNLVFIDIRMPGMTGIEVIGYAREHMKRQVQFVILTGYADFDYAKTAMRLNVSDYMLKPIQEKELLEVLMKLNGEYQQAQQTQREKYDFHMAQLLHGNFMEESVEWIQTFLEPAEEWKYVSFEFDKGCREFLALKREEKARQQKLLTGYLKSLMGKKEYHVVPMLETEENVFGAGLLLTKQLCADKDMEEAEYLDSFQKRVNCHFDYRIQIYAGQGVESLTQLPVSFRSVRVARCLHGLTEADSGIMTYEGSHDKKYSMAVKESDIEQLLEAIKENRTKEIGEAADHIFSQIRKSDMNMEMVNASIYHILYRLMEMVGEFDDETNQQEILEYIGKESFNKLVLTGDTGEITGFFLDYAGYLAQVRCQESRKVMDRVDEYVRAHYNEKLSLKSLGELFYVNNVYLGQLYKKEYGIVFRDYLNQLRMEKATWLLLHTNKRIYAIAEEVGFGKVDYFINKFVQTYHMTPNQYRMCNKKQDGSEQG